MIIVKRISDLASLLSALLRHSVPLSFPNESLVAYIVQHRPISSTLNLRN